MYDLSRTSSKRDSAIHDVFKKPCVLKKPELQSRQRFVRANSDYNK